MHLIDSLQPTETWLFNYLLNSLWQLPLLFAAAWLATRSLRRTGPAAQHRIWLTTLLLQLLLPACTFSPRQFVNTLASLIPWHTAHATTTAVIIITTAPAQAHNGLQLPALLLAIIVATYALTLLYFTARLIYGLRNTSALRRATQPIALSEDAAAIWQRCAHHFTTPNTQLAASTAAPYPLTIGIRHPLILLPTGMANTVPTNDLSAALAHEFAHIHRRDFAKNLAYTALSIPLAWHPILWLTRKHIAETREMICDALAAEALAGTQPYARSLLRLAALFVNAAPHRNLHAIGIFDTTTFERRLMNLTHKPAHLRTLQRIALTAAVLTLGLATCASALALRMNVSPSSTDAHTTAPQTAKALHVQPGDLFGNRLHMVEPVYPPEAKAAGIQGSVIFDATIGKDGTLTSLKLISGPPELTKSAWDAVKQWTWKPFLLNGQPVTVQTTLTVNFSLNPDKRPSPTPDPSPTAPTPSPSASNTLPKVINVVDPVYPAEAKAREVSFNGTVRVSLIVGKDGLPKDVAVNKSLSPDFDQSALAAVRQYKFKPALRDGSPVETRLYVDVNFQAMK